jgi:hypothetical protein
MPPSLSESLASPEEELADDVVGFILRMNPPSQHRYALINLCGFPVSPLFEKSLWSEKGRCGNITHTIVAGMLIDKSLANMEQPEGKTPASIHGPGDETKAAPFPPSSNLQGGIVLEQINVGQVQGNMRSGDSKSIQGTAPEHPASIRHSSLMAGKTPVFIAQWSPQQDMGLGGSTPRLPCRPVLDSSAPMTDDSKKKEGSSTSSSTSSTSRSTGYNSLRESMGETPRLPTRQSADSQFCGGNSSSPSSCPSVDDDRSSLSSDVGSPDFGRGQEREGSVVEADALLSITCFSASAMARHVPPLQIAAIPKASNSPAHSLRMLVEGSMTDGGLERDMERRLEELAKVGWPGKDVARIVGM